MTFISHKSNHFPISSLRTECDYEDEIYYVGETFESFYDPCTECRCDYPDVTCYPRYCPAPTCMYPAPDADGCCQMCYNCLFEGILYHNGQHFPDPSDPCAQCSCRMGDIQCTAVPCDRPRCPYPVPGRCCPECGSGCQYGDVIIPDGGMFPSGMAECQECICHAGYVTCVPTRCPDVYCTHPATVGCCPHCEGCLFEGRDIENGMVFSHPGKPCEECRCTAGSVTCNPLKCPEAPCTHPRVVNCCPSCSVGCRYHETLLEEGETIFSPSDPCHTCLCKRGSVKCARRKCPDLSCPVESQIPGECCPRCPTSHCLYEDKVYPHDARFTDPYTCQDCICQEGRVECSVLLCPELSCPNQVRVNGSCCPICDQSCEYNQVRYTAGQKFTPEDRPCQICTCEEGEIVCDDVPCGLPDCTHPIPADLNECCPFSCSGCSFEGKTFADGQSFNHSCSSCQCQVGNITCSPIKCPELKCDVPIVPEGEGCCATCPSCHHMGITLPPEYRFIDPDQPCSLCVCHNGEVTCFHETCPAEDCRPGEVFQKLQPEDCCPVCMNSLDAINSNARGTYDEVGTEDIQYYAHEQKKEERIIFQLEKGLGSIQTFVYNKDVSKGGSLNETLGQEEPSAIDEGHVEGSLEDDFLRNVSLAAGEEPELVSVNLDQLEEQYRPEFHANEPDVLGLNITSSTSEFSTQNVSKEEGEDESAETPENSTEITTTLSPAAPDEHDFNETFSNFEDSNDTTAGNTTAVPSSNSSISQQELAQRINSKLKDLTFNVALPSDKEQLKFNVKIKVSKRMNDSDTEIPRGVTKRKCRGKNPFNIVQISESEPPTPSNISVFTSNSNENDTSLSLNEVSDDIEGTQRPPASLLLPNISTDDSDNITSTTPKHQETLIITSDHAPSVSNYAYLEREKEILEHIIAEGVKLSEFQNESGNINEENIDITTVTPLSSTSTTEAPDSSKDSQLDTVFSVLPSRSVELSTSKPDLTKEFESSEIPKEGSSTSLVEDFSESINEQHSIPSPPYSSIHHPEAVTYSTESPSDDFYSISTSPSATQSHSLSSAGIQSTEATPHLTSPFPLHVANSSIMEDLTTSIIASNDIPVTISPSPSSKEDSMDTSLEDYKNLGNSRADTEQTTSPANVLVVSTASSETLPSESSILLMMNGTRYPTTDSPDNSNSKSEPGYSELFGENGETNLVSFEENPVLITAASTDASSLDLDVATEAALSFLESSVTTEQGFANVSNVTDLRPTSLGEVTVTAMPTSNSTSTYLPLGGHCDFEEVGKSVSLPDDPCTNCTCNSSLHWECSQVWCPPLDCPLEELYLHEGECCPICKACEVSIGNQLLQYGEGESWSDPRKPCSVCVCHNGHSRCSASHCISPPQIYSPADCLGVTCPELKCTESQEERYNPGACCPVCAPASQRCVWWGRHIRTFDGLLLQHRSQCAYTFLQHCPETLFTIYTKFGDSSRGLAVVVVTVVVGEVEIELGQDGGVTVDGIKESLPHITSTTAIYSHGHNVVLITNNGLQVVWHVRGQVEVVVGGEHMGKTCGLCGNLNNHPQDDFSLPSGLQSTNIEEFLESWSIGEKCVAPEPQRFCSKSGAALDSHSYGYVNRSCSILKGPSFQKCHRVVPPDPYIEACITEVCGCQEETRSVCLCDSLHLYSTLCTRAGVILNWRTSYLCEPSCPLGMVWSECVPACGPALCGPPPASRTVKHNSFVSFLSAVSSHSVSSHENTPAQKCPGPCVPGCTCPRGYALQNATCIPLTECL
ncbi:kielin/chordin-like protein [Macrobrachium nipponense]|uniref:kielin/chordin-like protein n=1 Tax=Macrobrachium nipponense TaxID=159736 RepID=UPI0030C85D35